MTEYYSPIVYGPILSRRLGRSLGISLLPINNRICTYDCIYCECGKSCDSQGVAITSNSRFLKPNDLRLELEKWFKWHAIRRTRVDYITFAGNGEPTLYPWFDEAVDITLEMRDRYLPLKQTAIFTNATAVSSSEVINCLFKFDRRFIKLDAGDQKTYFLINKPLTKISIAKLVEDLCTLLNIELSSAVVDGSASNIESIRSSHFIEIISRIKPLRLFIYAIDRPTAYDGVVRVDQAVLLELAVFLEKNIEIPVVALESIENRPSWFEESYFGNIGFNEPKVYPIGEKGSVQETIA